MDDVSVVSDTKVLMRIDNTGDVIWTPNGIYKTHCDTDVTFYPFDTQDCDVTVSAWGYTSIELSLVLDNNPVRKSFYRENGEWKFEGYTARSTSNSREGASTPEVTFTLSFKRRPAFHVLTTLIPVFLLAVLSAMVFKLPADEGEKMGYSLTVLLAYAVYLTIISTNLPSSSSSTAILTVYLLLVLALGVLSVIITIYALDIHHKDESLPVSNRVKRLVTGFCAPIACWKQHRCICWRKIRPESKDKGYEEKVANADKSNNVVKDNDASNDADLTWKDVSHIVDAFFLRIYLFVIVTLNVAVLISLLVGYSKT